jgi:putative ATP-binding cassette transporter
LIAGTSEAGKTAFFKATAGIVAAGRGRIIRPSTPFMQFLAERPYLPPGTLREALVPTILSSKISNDHLFGLFKELNLESVLARANGFDTEHDWITFLSLGEQQLLSFIHIFLAAPRFIFLDHPSSALKPDQIRMIFDLLNRHSITYFTVEDSENEIEFYDALLEINEKGQWAWRLFSAGSTAA